MLLASYTADTTNAPARTARRRAAVARRGAPVCDAHVGPRRAPTPVVRRGTHRTRVSEKRLVAAPIAASRPHLAGVTPRIGHVAQRERGARMRSGTG